MRTGVVPRTRATTWGSSSASRKAIRGVDPAARIVFGGLFPFPSPDFGVKAAHFPQGFLRPPRRPDVVRRALGAPLLVYARRRGPSVQDVPQAPQPAQQPPHSVVDHRARLEHKRQWLGDYGLPHHGAPRQAQYLTHSFWTH